MAYTWQCPLCSEAISTAFQRNLLPLMYEHKQICPHRDTPRERLPLSPSDQKFLQELKVAW